MPAGDPTCKGNSTTHFRNRSTKPRLRHESVRMKEPAERGTANDLNGGGIVINSWDPLALRGLSDFNAYHQINANLVYQLPFGKGQRFVGGASPLLNELVGGWHV